MATKRSIQFETTVASDSQLAKDSQSGDLIAFEQLVQRYQHPLVCFLQFYCSAIHDVEDVAQEAFMQCYLHIHQFDPDRNFKTWLYTIARRLLPRVRPKSTIPLSEPDEFFSHQLQPDVIAVQLEQRQSLWKKIRDVCSDDEFQLIWFRYADRLSMIEIAQVTGEKSDVCKMRLSRIRKRLKLHLQPFMEDGCPVFSLATSKKIAG